MKTVRVSETTRRRFAKRGYTDVRLSMSTNATVNGAPYGPVLQLRAEGHGHKPVVSMTQADADEITIEKVEEIARSALEHIDAARGAA